MSDRTGALIVCGCGWQAKFVGCLTEAETKEVGDRLAGIHNELRHSAEPSQIRDWRELDEAEEDSERPRLMN